MWKKKWILWVAGLIILGVACGIYLYTKPVGKTSRLQPDYTMTAEELFNEFNDDESAAEKTYLDKVIAVTGKVMDLEPGQVMKVRLQSNHPIFGVLCELEDGQEIPDLREGEEIEIKGICTGKLMDVILKRCIEM